MSPQVVQALLNRRPFVAFTVWLQNEEMIEIRRPEAARLLDENSTLCVLDPDDLTQTLLIDLKLIERLSVSEAMKVSDKNWPFQ